MPDNKAKNPFAEFGGDIIKKQEKNAFSEFGGELVTPKKKVATALPSEEKAVSSSSATQGTEEQKPSVSSGSESNLYKYKGRPNAVYKKKGDTWFVDVNNSGSFQKINEQNRSLELNKNAEKIQSDLIRPNGTVKGKGFLGELDMKDGSGKKATEMTIGIDIDGKPTDIPLIVPTLSDDELDWLLKGNDPLKRNEMSDKIVDKAISFAKQRINNGKPLYAEPNEYGKGSVKNNVFTGYPGKEGKKYQLKDGVWYEYSSTIPKEGGKNVDLYEKPIKDAKRVESLNKVFKQNASTNEYQKTFTGFPGQEGSEYRIINGIWEKKSYGKKDFTPIVNDESVKYLNKHFNQSAKKATKQEIEASNITKSINQNLTGKSEEELVPQLKNMFKGTDNDIFEFEQTGVGYDALKVKNKFSGQEITINLDNWTKDRDNQEAKLLKGFIDVNLKFKDQALNQKKINDLQDLKRKQNPTEALYTQKQIDDLQKDIDADEKIKQNYALAGGKETASAIYNKNSVNNIKAKLDRVYVSSIDLKAQKKDLENWKAKADAGLSDGSISKDQYDNEIMPKIKAEEDLINKNAKDLIDGANGIKKETVNINRIAGLYVKSQEDRGNILSGTASSALKGITTGVTGMPLFFMSLSKGNDMDFNKITESIAEETTVGGTSKEYLTSQNRGDFEKAIFGVVESVGQAVGGVGTSSTLSLMGSTYVNFRSEIDSNPELKELPNYEKVLLSSALAAPIGILEKLGLDEMTSKTPAGKKAVDWILKKTFSTLPKNASKEVLESTIQENLKAALTRGLLTITEKGLIEGSTEALETNVELSTKSIYDWAKGTDAFNTPKTIGGWLEATGESFKLGMIGGAAINTATQSLKIPVDKMTMNDINNAATSIVDKDLKDLVVSSLKSKVATGEISKQEALGMLSNMNNLESVISKVPSEFSDESKFTAIKLVDEKKKLEKDIQGKDEASVFAQKERINAINEELKTISLNNATKESTEQQQEVPTESNISERQGTTEGQQEVGEGEGSERTATQPEANISDSNISSEEEKINKEWKDAYEEYYRTDKDSILLSQGFNPKNKKQAQAHKEAFQRAREKTDKIDAEYYAKLDALKAKQTEAEMVPKQTPAAQVIPSIETKIEEYEQRTENEVVAPNIETTKTKKAKSIPRTKKALEVETNDLQDIVKKHFISGGKINVNSAMQSLFGNKNGKSIASEYKKRIGLHAKLGSTVDGLAHLLWEQNRDTLGDSTTTMEWRDAIESVLTDNVGTKNMIDSLLAKSEESITDAEAKYWEDKYDLNALEGFDESELMDAESVLDNMTDEEMAQMYDEIIASEQAEYNPTIEDAKKLDPKDKLYSKKVYDILESQKQALIQFSKESSGAFIIPPSVLVKVIEGLQKAVELGMTFEEAIRDYASKNNMKTEDIEDSLFNLSETQKRKTRERLTGEKQPDVKQSKEAIEAKELSKRKTKKITVDEVAALKDQIRLEAKAAKEGAKSVSDSIKEITKHFNLLSDKNKLNRKDLIKIINLISKVKNSESLNNTIPKLFDIMDNANSDIIEVSQKAALKTQLKLEAKAAKNVDLEIRAKQKEVKTEIRDLVRKGIMNTSQASLILRKLASVNFLKQKSIDDFLVHYNKVMTNAEYAKKLSDAFKNRTKIKNTYKKNQATFRTIAENFLKINPLTVQNIDIYGDLADRVLNASKTTSIKKGEVSPKEAIEYNDAVYKIHQMIEHQEELIKQRLLEDYDYMVQSGAINSNMSLSDIREILKEGSEDEAKLREAEDAAKSFLNARLSALSFELDELKRTGTNPSELMQKVANVDMDLLNKNDIIALADAIDNFIMNGVTDGVGSIMSRYEAKENINKAKRVVRSERVEYIAPVLNWVKNKVSKHKVISKREVLKWRLENFVTLPLLVERIFPGVNNASRFNRLSSISEISEGKTKAIKRVNNKQDEYFNKFNKAKMKSGRFFDASNVVFRGFYADLIRNAGKTELEQNKEFLMKVDNIRRSIETLSASSIEQDLLKAKLYQEVYDNINKDSYESFISNPGDVDPVNVAAVNFGRDMFAEIYPDLEKVSLEYYNTQLNGEANYSSARYIKSTNQSIEAMDELDFRDDRMIDSKEVKTMKAAKVRPLNDGEYVDLTFDSNLFKSYRESLIAIETSAARMKMKEFFKDKNFKEIIADNQDRYLIQKASADFVNDTMGYTKDVDDKTMAKAMRWLSEYAAVRNLGSVFAVVKQSVTVALNTLVITGEMPLPLNPLKGVPKDQSDFLDRNGVSVGLRGGDSALAIKKANEYVGKLTENTASIKNKISHATEAVKEGSLKPMTYGDVVSNKLSWFAFYKQSLRDQGLDSKNIDWNTHEFNKEASDYATQMIDRSQNPSDFDMMAKFFKSKNQWANLTKSILLPYASFNVNAKKKIVSDINTLKSKVASPRDKTIAIRSLTGTFAEVASFNALGVAWRTFVVNAIAGALTGDDDDDEVKKDLERELTYFKKNMYSEYVSPSPVFNESVLSASAWVYDEFIRGYQEDIDAENKSREEKGKDKMTTDEESKFVESIKLNDATHSAKAKDFFESFGAIGTIGKQVSDFYDLSKTAGNKSFIDKYGNNKNLSEQQINKLRYIQAVDGLSLLLGIPKDVKSVANAAEKKILFKTLTDAGVKRMHDVEEYMDRKITDNEYKLVSKISSVRHLLYVLEELEGNEKAQNEAYKLSEEGIDVADYEVIEDLKKGRTAEQIKAK